MVEGVFAAREVAQKRERLMKLIYLLCSIVSCLPVGERRGRRSGRADERPAIQEGCQCLLQIIALTLSSLFLKFKTNVLI